MTTNEAIQRKFTFVGRRASLPWYPRKGRREDLADLFGQLGFNSGVEVGTRKGAFAEILCRANPGLRLHCVDPWAAYAGNSQKHQDETYDQAVGRLANLNVNIIRKPSLVAVDDFADGSLDFVYIDGDHRFDAVVRDIIVWVPKVRSEGIVALHDYHASCGIDVMMAINAYTHCHDIRPWYITKEEWPTAFWVKR